MNHRPSHAIGRCSGRVGTVVLTGMVAGVLMMAGCRTAAQAGRVHMRQEMDYVTVNISNSDGSVGRVQLRTPTGDELKPACGF